MQHDHTRTPPKSGSMSARLPVTQEFWCSHSPTQERGSVPHALRGWKTLVVGFAGYSWAVSLACSPAGG